MRPLHHIVGNHLRFPKAQPLNGQAPGLVKLVATTLWPKSTGEACPCLRLPSTHLQTRREATETMHRPRGLQFPPLLAALLKQGCEGVIEKATTRHHR